MRYVIAVLLLFAGSVPGVCQDPPPAPPAPPATPQAEAGEAQGQGQAVMMTARWPGRDDMSNTVFRVFSDQALTDLVDVFPAGGAGGSAIMALRPGEYYVMAVVDVNGNGQADPGDGFGFYGVNDLSPASRPQPLVVREDAINAGRITILMTIGEDGRLVPIAEAIAAADGYVAGSVSGAAMPIFLLLVPVDEGGHPVAVLPAEDGSYRAATAPGRYRLCALADANADGILGAGDPVALVGFGDAEPLTVKPGEELAVAPLALAPAAEPPAGVPPVCLGRVTGVTPPEGAVIQVAFCTDAGLRQQAFAVAADASGRFVTAAAPGAYYLRATVDQAGDGTLGAGDMLGFYGVADLMGGDTPQPLALVAEAVRTDVTIAITARIGEDGRLTTYTAPDADATAPGDAAGE